MKTLIVILIQFIAVHSASAQTEQNVRPLSATAGEQWKIRWDRSDDFNKDEIDWRKWNPKPEKFNGWAWDNENNTSVVDGAVQITVRQVEQATKPTADNSDSSARIYTSGMLKSYAQDCYGYYEARIKGAPVFPGVCPAFWLYSRIDDSQQAEGAVRYSEIDVVEMTQRGDRIEGNERITDHNLHAILSNGKMGVSGRDWQRPNDPRYQEGQAIEYHAPFDPREGFHTYGCHVGKEEIIWYVDGVEVGRKPNEFWHRQMNVALSFGLRAPFSIFKDNRLVANHDADTSDLPTAMLVDYVRVWDLVENPD